MGCVYRHCLHYHFVDLVSVNVFLGGSSFTFVVCCYLGGLFFCVAHHSPPPPTPSALSFLVTFRNRYDTELLAHKMEKSEWSQCIVFYMTDLALLFLFCCLICCCLCMGDSACGDGGGGGAEAGGAEAAAGGAGDVGNLA